MARPFATPEQRAAQRQRIRRAAKAIYDEGGLDAVTVRRVSEQAGVSQGTIYSYFHNRLDLVRSLWLAPVQEAGHQLEQLAAGIDDAEERLRAILAFFKDFAVSNPDVHRGTMLFVRAADRELPEPQPRDQLPFYRLLREALVELRHQGRLVPNAPEPPLLAEMLWAALHGSLALSVNADAYQVATADELGSEMIDFLLDSILVAD